MQKTFRRKYALQDENNSSNFVIWLDDQIKMKFYFISILALLQFLITTAVVAQDEFPAKYDFSMVDENLSDGLFRLSEITEIPISFSNNNIDNRKYSYDFRQKSLKYILKQLLSDQNLDFEISNNKILIFKKENLLTLSGYIEDASTGERLIGANIYRSDKFGGAISNDYGFFSLTIPEDNNLTISYLGYKTKVINAANLKENILIINLEQSLTFEEIVITDKIENANYDFYNQDIDTRIVQKTSITPSLGGEPDVLRNIMQLPSVQTGPDGFGGIFVRGGNADQNLVLLDGVPIYNPYHTLGIFSIFDHNMVRNVKFHSGNFPARYGGRVSSVVDVRTKEGNNKKLQFDGSTGLIASKMTLQGPIIKNKAAFIVSARRTHLDPFIDYFSEKTIFDSNDGDFNYFFGEIMAKVNFQISPKDRIYASYYIGKDAYRNASMDTFSLSNLENVIVSDQQTLEWGNQLAVGRWNHAFNNQTFTNLTVTYSEFKFSTTERYNQEYNFADETFFFTIASAFNSKITNISAKYDLDYIVNNQHYLKAGIQVGTNEFQPGIINYRDSVSFSNSVNLETNNVPSTETLEFSGYVEDDWNITSRWKVNLGVYASLFNVKNKQYLRIDPRIYTEFKLGEKILLSASYNHLHQNVHLLSRSGSGFPTDLWVPSTDKIKPQVSRIGALAFHWNMNKNWRFSSELYYKTMKNLVFFQENAGSNVNLGISAANWEDRTINGTGISKGIEFSLLFNRKKFQSWVHYTLSDSQRTFPELNEGKSFPFKFDNRHKINLGFIANLTKRWSASSSWSYASGSHVTLQKSSWLYVDTDFFVIDYIDFTDINAYQLPAYHRLDVSLKYKHQGKRANWSFDIGTYNAYNRKNPYFIRPRYDFETDSFSYKQIVLIPLLPYFNFSIRI